MNERVEPYHKDRDFEGTWEEVNERLSPLERNLIGAFDEPKKPVILIAGTQRSGTTLLEQVIIDSFDVGYVDNLMARFWKAPYLGALLTNELSRRSPESEEPKFKSELGTTYGYEGPHEFGFFWDRWVSYGESHQLNSDQKREIDSDLLLQEMAAVESVFEAPLVFKNPLAFTLNIPLWVDLIPQSLFLICRRDPLYTAQSTLKSRMKRFGDKNKWWSIKPRAYSDLKELPYHEQIVGQIYYTLKRLDKTLTDVEDSRYLEVQYKDLCRQPVEEMDRLRNALREKGHDLEKSDCGRNSFDNRNLKQINDQDFKLLQEACKSYGVCNV